MEKEHTSGAMDKAKGTVKDKVGEATGDEKLRNEGKFDKAKGEVKEKIGDAKDSVKNA